MPPPPQQRQDLGPVPTIPTVLRVGPGGEGAEGTVQGPCPDQETVDDAMVDKSQALFRLESSGASDVMTNPGTP